MGLFGSSTKITVFSQAQSLMKPNAFSQEDAVLYAVLKHQSIAATLVNTLTGGMAIKAEAARKYAKNYYTLGLPDSQGGSSTRIDDDVAAQVVTEDLSLPYGCITVFNYMAPITAEAIIMPILIDQRNYDLLNNTIPELPLGWVVPTTYLENALTLKACYVTNLFFDIDMETITVTYSAVLTYSKWEVVDLHSIHSTYTVPTTAYTSTYTETFNVPSGFQVGKDYAVVGYRPKDIEGNASEDIQWWYYSLDLGLYPELTPDLHEQEDNSGYPVIPLRYHNEFIGEDNHPEIYTTGGKVLRKLGLYTDTLVDTLSENPDIDSIDNAYVMFGIDLQTTDEIALEYLVEFFTMLMESDDQTVWDVLSDSMGITPQGPYSSTGFVRKINTYHFGVSGSSNTPSVSTSVRDNFGGTDLITTHVTNPASTLSFTEHGLDVILNYREITSILITGSIGEVGEITKEIIPDITTFTMSGVFSSGARTIDKSKLILKQQVATNVYRQVTVTGLSHKNNVYGSHAVYTTLEDVNDDEDEHNFIIPLHHKAVLRLGRFKKNRLYEQSLFLIITGYDKTKVKWYQSGLFKFIMIVVAIIVTFYTGQAWLVALAAAENALVFVVVSALVAVAGSIAAKELIKIVGPEWGMLIALVAMVIGVKYPIGGSFTVYGVEMATAETFLSIEMSTMQAANTAINEMLKDVMAEFDDFAIDAEAKMEMLKAKQELLETEYLLPFSYLDPPFYSVPETYTKPDLLYNKVHIGNIGTLSLDVVENYVTMALFLPEPETEI